MGDRRDQTIMTEEEITRSLQTEAIEPSADFQSRVMRQIRREAELPPPIPFPWRRASWIAAALAAGLAAPLFEPELIAERTGDVNWLWCLGAVAASALAASAPRRLMELR